MLNTRSDGSIIHPSRLSVSVDLDKYPEKVDVLTNPKHFTIGDLHGNALKMIYFLIKTNVLNISPEDYYKLRDVYHEIEKGSMKAIFDFKKMIESFPLSKPNSDIKIRFLGDLLADRGANDYLTLLVLSLLQETKYEIIFSNHDLEYLTHSEREDLKNIYSDGYINPACTSSLKKLKEFLNSQTEIKPEDIHRLENLYYKPHLKLLSCTLPKKEDHAHIYSHALIDLKTIENMARKFGIGTTHIRESRAHLCKIINEINLYFQNAVEKKTAHLLFDLETSNAGGGGSKVDYKYPLEQTVWNRVLDKYEIREHNKAAYILDFYHGHTDATKFPHYHGYDNHLGKGVGYHVGTLEIYSSENPSSSAFEQEDKKPLTASPTLFPSVKKHNSNKTSDPYSELFDVVCRIATETRTPNALDGLRKTKRNIDVHINGTRPITVLAIQGNHEAVEFLIKAGSNPDYAVKGYLACGAFLSAHKATLLLDKFESEVRQRLAEAASKHTLSFDIMKVVDTMNKLSILSQSLK